MSFLIDPFRMVPPVEPVVLSPLMAHAELARSVKNSDTYTVSVPVQENGRTAVIIWTAAENSVPVSASIGGVTADLFNIQVVSSPYNNTIYIADGVSPDGSGNADLVIQYAAAFAGEYRRFGAVYGAAGGDGSNELIAQHAGSENPITLSGIEISEKQAGLCSASHVFYTSACSWSGADEDIDAAGITRDSTALITGLSENDVSFTGPGGAGYQAAVQIVKLS